MKDITFDSLLNNRIQKTQGFLCIGLDPQQEKLPAQFQKQKTPLFSFSKAIVDATHDLVIAYKPNVAFFEAYGSVGVQELHDLCVYIKTTYSDIPLIIDAKRADIGSTNTGYVSYVFDYLQGDAVTINPYLGKEAVQPFLDRKEKGSIVLCKTSNPGSGEFQNQMLNGKPLYENIAYAVATSWNTNNNCLLVVGATYPKELSVVRQIVGDMTILIPGVGAQGGSLEETIANGLNSRKEGLIISMSRSVLYASNGPDFADAAREEALCVKMVMKQSLHKQP